MARALQTDRGPERSTGEAVVRIARGLSAAVDALEFAAPVAYVYNPLGYARRPAEVYLRRYARALTGDRTRADDLAALKFDVDCASILPPAVAAVGGSPGLRNSR